MILNWVSDTLRDKWTTRSSIKLIGPESGPNSSVHRRIENDTVWTQEPAQIEPY